MFSLLPNQTDISLFYIGTLDGRCHCSGVGRKRAWAHRWEEEKEGSRVWRKRGLLQATREASGSRSSKADKWRAKRALVQLWTRESSIAVHR
jgi:hypothetical protein